MLGSSGCLRGPDQLERAGDRSTSQKLSETVDLNFIPSHAGQHQCWDMLGGGNNMGQHTKWTESFPSHVRRVGRHQCLTTKWTEIASLTVGQRASLRCDRGRAASGKNLSLWGSSAHSGGRSSPFPGPLPRAACSAKILPNGKSSCMACVVLRGNATHQISAMHRCD